MTVDRIIQDVEAHDLPMSVGRIGGADKRWAARIGPELRNMRLADTFDDAVLAAWTAYTNAEGAR